MAKNRQGNSQGKALRRILLLPIGLALLLTLLLRGHNVAMLNPKGMIAHQQRGLMIFTITLLLTAAVPVVFLLFFTAWRYRESNAHAIHDPNVRHTKLLDLSMWLIPSIFMLVLALVMWPATHKLAPQKVIAAGVKPLTIQVVSMRWKWLFIYPEQNIATVNFVQIPAHTPVQFELTADEAPMSSFWIPNLAGQLYTMTGMVNHLNLMADTPGDYPGSSAEINGEGFANMKFTARVGSDAQFAEWVNTVKESAQTLNPHTYSELVKPSTLDAQQYYAATDPGLYNTIVMKYMGPAGEHTHHQ